MKVKDEVYAKRHRKYGFIESISKTNGKYPYKVRFGINDYTYCTEAEIEPIDGTELSKIKQKNK